MGGKGGDLTASTLAANTLGVGAAAENSDEKLAKDM